MYICDFVFDEMTGGSKMASILESCPSLQSIYCPTPYCLNPHFQFVPFIIEGLVKKFVKPPFKWYREWVVCADGTRLALDWVISAQIHHILGYYYYFKY